MGRQIFTAGIILANALVEQRTLALGLNLRNLCDVVGISSYLEATDSLRLQPGLSQLAIPTLEAVVVFTKGRAALCVIIERS